jgi:hypothetical protein
VIQTNASWDAKNALMAKQPIYVLQIGGQATVYSTLDLAAMGVTGAPAYEPWLKTPQGVSQTVDVLNGRSSLGEMQCEVVDQGGAIRTLVGTNTLEGAAATLWVGYPGLDWSQFVALHTYRLYKINPTAGYTSWMFVARDAQLLTKKTVYLNPENGELLSADNPWYLNGTPAEMFQAVCLLALRLAASDIDRAQMVLLDDPAEGLYAGARPFLFALTESFEAQQFLENEVLKPSGLYPVVTNTGQLSLRAMRPPAAGPTPVFTFTGDNMVVLPNIDRMPVVNEVVFKYDHDGSNFQTQRTFLEATSLSTFGRGNQWTVESKGLASELGAAWFSEWVADKLFRRFAGTPTGLRGGAPVIDIEAFFMTLPVWDGDYVGVTHSLMPDVTSGALGVTDRIYEVIDRQPDYANGRMKFRLLDTGLTGAAPRCTWGAGSANPLVIGAGKWF